jgi:hypothetical protein
MWLLLTIYFTCLILYMAYLTRVHIDKERRHMVVDSEGQLKEEIK